MRVTVTSGIAELGMLKTSVSEHSEQDKYTIHATIFTLADFE